MDEAGWRRAPWGLVTAALALATNACSAAPAPVCSPTAVPPSAAPKVAAKGSTQPLPLTDVSALVKQLSSGILSLVGRRDEADSEAASAYVGGSGILISDTGLVVTNLHVTRGVEALFARSGDGRMLRTELVAVDEATDLAVLRLLGDLAGLKPLVWAESTQLDLGASVIALGNARSDGLTVSVGVVSATGRSVGYAKYEDFIMTDARITSGNSGGALVNAEGQLVGINTAVLIPELARTGFGLAISARLARPTVAQLIEFGEVRRGHVGVRLQDLEPASQLDQASINRGGVQIAEVEPAGPADKAGLKAGDVVTRVNHWQTRTRAQFRAALSFVAADQSVPLEIVRAGQVLQKDLIPGRQSAAVAAPQSAAGSANGDAK